jgi:hypothetical protein
MSPPTEQLIRDYLNRLSVAGRGQLGPDDRRALVTRTRDFIERKTGLAGPPTAVEVARLLSGLGDPAGLVQQERQRLAAVRGEVHEPAAGRTRLARVLRRDPGSARGASWHWPVQEGSTDLQVTLLDGSVTDHDASDHDVPDHEGTDDEGTAASGTVLPGTTMNGTAENGTAENGTAENGTGPKVPAQAGEPSWFMESFGSRRSDESEPVARVVEQAQPEAGPSKPQWPSLVAGRGESAQPGDSGPPASGEAQPAEAQLAEAQLAEAEPAGAAAEVEPAEVEPVESEPVDTATQQPADMGSHAADDVAPAAATPAWQLTTPTESVIARRVRPAARALISWYRRRPLEASAVVLLGVGGASYPPLWLLGAALALASQLWDYRDKWVGLALPLVLTVIGTVLGIAKGGHMSLGNSVHEGWIYAVVVSRIAAALGASYLAWRTLHDRRPPAVPPWNRPHKIG